MAEVQFNEGSYAAPVGAAGPTGLSGLIVRWGLAGDARQAQRVLLAVLVVALLATAGLFVLGGAGGSSAKPPVPNVDGTPRLNP